MGKNDQPKPEKDEKDEYAPGTVKGELDFYDNVLKPIMQNRKEIEEWEKQNKGK